MTKNKDELRGKDVHVKGSRQHGELRREGEPTPGMQKAEERKKEERAGKH